MNTSDSVIKIPQNHPFVLDGNPCRHVPGKSVACMIPVDLQEAIKVFAGGRCAVNGVCLACAQRENVTCLYEMFMTAHRTHKPEVPLSQVVGTIYGLPAMHHNLMVIEPEQVLSCAQ